MSKQVKEFEKNKNLWNWINLHRWWVVGLVGLLAVAAGVLIWASGGTDEEEMMVQDQKKAVTVLKAEDKPKQNSINYLGVIQPEVVIEKTFSSFMKVEAVYVKEGEYVDVGDPLMTLDTTSLENDLSEQGYQVRNARKQKESAEEAVEAAELQLKAAQNTTTQEDIDAAEDQLVAASQALDDAEAAYIQGQQDFADGNISQADLDELERQYIVAQANYSAAQAQYQAVTTPGADIDVQIAQAELEAAQAALTAAEANYNLQYEIYKNMESMLDDSTIYADMEGFIISVLYDAGETVNPITPALVLGSKQMIITVGLSRNDAKSITEETPVEVEIDEADYAAHIISISKLPDEQAKTYECKIAFESERTDFFIGDIGTVRFIVDTDTGIWIPISAIMNDGAQYVFVVTDGYAEKRYIEIKAMSNDLVKVGGLNDGEAVIIKGMTAIQDGQEVDIIGEES